MVCVKVGATLITCTEDVVIRNIFSGDITDGKNTACEPALAENVRAIDKRYFK